MSNVIYVIGSGASLNYVNPKFFEGVKTIGVNYAYRFFDCDMNVVHHKRCLANMVNDGARGIHASEFDTGVKSKGVNPHYEGVYYFHHEEQPYLRPNFGIQEREGWLVEGGTTIIPAMSLAAKLADRIILCGVDGDTFKGRNSYEGYYKDRSAEMGQNKHSIDTNKVVRDFKRYLESQGKFVYALNPFVNVNYK